MEGCDRILRSTTQKNILGNKDIILGDMAESNVGNLRL